MIERGCGKRKQGGAYLTVDTSPDGAPIEYFLVDEPQRVILGALGISPRGIHLIERDGIWHAFDVIGSEHYPNVADFIEEARLLGVSRRCELQDYSKLTKDSRLILIHARAWIENTEIYWSEIDEETRRLKCPRQQDQHDLDSNCAGYWYHDLDPGDLEGDSFDASQRKARTLPSGAVYFAYPRPEGVTPEYHYAIFASFPIGRIEVIKDQSDNTHLDQLRKARKSGLEVALAEE